MRLTTIIIILGTILLNVRSVADEPSHFTGMPRVDFFSNTLRLAQDSLEVVGSEPSQEKLAVQTKSPWVAGALSFAVPGAGEYYSESYVKSAIFLTAEIAGWVVAYVYDNKGNRQTTDFQNYADAHWSVIKYVRWLADFRSANFSGIVTDPNAMPPWNGVNWDSLNFYERLIASGPDGRGFTHTLPPHGEQQYYELIGKYPQYSSGWDDFPPGSPDFLSLSARFREYSQMRGKANDYYNIASTAISVIVVNHVISAIDAYFTAASFTRSIRAEARMNLRHTPFGPVAETVGAVKILF